MKAKLEDEASRILKNAKIDPQFMALKEDLQNRIQIKEKMLEQQYDRLSQRVKEKERDLEHLKRIFVEKLRDLETSFVEISNEVVETEQVTQNVTAKRKQEIQTLLEQKPSNNLDRSMELILSNYDDKDENSRQYEELSQANHDLLEQNERLKAQLEQSSALSSARTKESSGPKDKKQDENLHAEMVIELNEQIDELKQECERLQKQLTLATASESMYQKEIKGLKYDNKRMSMDTRDNKERYEQAIKGLRERQESERKDFQQQFGALKQASVAYKQQFSDSQIKYSQTLKLLNTARIASEDLEDQLEYAKKENVKQAKGTRLVICLQNYVRKMLQEKLEEQARQLAALKGQNSDEVNNLRRRASELEEDQIQADSEAV